MICKLPVLIKKLNDDGTVSKEKKYINAEIDTSFLAHLKFEEEFSKNMGGIDLNTFTAQVENILKDPVQSKAKILVLLKWLYCFINAKELPDFKSFLKMLDYEVVAEILETIKNVLEETAKTASKN